MRFALLLLFLLFTNFAQAKPSDISLCETYPQVNNQLCCVNTNYLIEFGYFYCRKYVELENTFTPATQIVLSKIRSCLVHEVISDHELSCSNSEERAMQHHLKCYKAAGFCGLTLSEKWKIFKVAQKEASRPSFRRTMEAVFEQCGGVGSIFNLDEPISQDQY